MNAHALWSRSQRILVAAACCLAGTGCFTKGIVRGDGLDALRQPGRRGELVLQTKEGGRARLGPNTKVRFLRSDDEWSAWIEGRDLCVTPEAAFQCSSLPGGPGLPWKGVSGIETKNLDGAATYFTVLGVVVGTAVAVAVTVAMVAAVAGLAKGGGGGFPKIDSLNLGSGGGRGAKAVSRTGPTGVISPSFAPAEYDLHYAIARGWRWYGPPIEEPAYAPELAEAELAPVPLPGAAPAVQPEPLFTSMTSRRGHVRLVGALEGGTDLTATSNGVGGASLALRLGDVVELGGGARLAVAPERPSEASAALRQSWLGFGRLLAHFDLDSDRRVAFVLGAECGAGHPKIYGRAIYGLRVRLVDGLAVGLYPYNASVAVYDLASRQRRDLGWFSFPSTAELSYAF
ncbi:MAG TPA: hypothetical protein VGK67_31445 [Myxococcales bacterium]|jgi:hypothetical protein